MTVEEAIAAGAGAFDRAETRARETKEEFRRMRKTFEVVRDAGRIGALECQALAGAADALATQFEADVWAMHRDLTMRAQELGIDLPVIAGGGDR